MATFTNQAALTYNGVTTSSNIVTGEILEPLRVTKDAVNASYNDTEAVTYVVNLVNTGSAALTGLTVTDDLGAYTAGALTAVPLTYVDGTVRYYTNGVLQAAPAVVEGPPLTFSGLTVPAGGNGLLLYDARPNRTAPLAAGATMTNTVTVSGAGLTTPVQAAQTVAVATAPRLRIGKSVSPASVSPGGRLTYTFTIENTGNTAADAADLVSLTDTFTPVLRDLAVALNGTAWAPATNYTYNATTGVFATVPGQITGPAATYAQNTATGAWTVTPGASTLTVAGTVT